MKIKRKFLDVNLGDLAYGTDKPFDAAGITIPGKKIFQVMPRTEGDPEGLNDAATWKYLQERKEGIRGDAELLVLPILQKDIDSKGIVFQYPVASGLHGSVMAQVLHGPELARDMDFTLMANGAGISWDGYALDGRIEVGDVLVVAYKRGGMLVEPFAVTAFTGGVDLSAGYKYFAGVLAGNGCIYAPPSDVSDVLKIDPSTQAVSKLGFNNPYPDWSYMCAAVAGNGCIYAPPYWRDTEQILKINPADDGISLFGAIDYNDYGNSYLWSDAITAGNGYIYCIPGGATKILRIDPSNDSYTVVADFGYDNWLKWDGAVLANGYIYGIPLNSATVLKFDPSTETFDRFGDLGTAQNKWRGGALAGNGKIYCSPNGSENVLVIDTSDDSTYTIGSGLTGTFKWGRPVLAGDGKVYAMPEDKNTILCIDPATDTVSEIGPYEFFNDEDMFIGCVAGGNGKLYGIPYNAEFIVEVSGVGA
jgi:hypothetical protein